MGYMNGKAEGARRLAASYTITIAEAEFRLDAFTDALEEVVDTDMEGTGEVYRRMAERLGLTPAEAERFMDDFQKAVEAAYEEQQW
ncbi:hypothetical protein OG592_43595 (plasmid) [Streptomyces avidinii]|uniref:hypothetical protein n=1 Tax=Streptomyces avidinii TaxID=1895 RepID=UPI002F9164CE|nr:hypothetical protein OG592_43595 [Streptomyces avidinii]